MNMEQATVLQVILLVLGVVTSALATIIISMLSNLRSDMKDVWREIGKSQARQHQHELDVQEKFLRKDEMASIIEGIVKGLRASKDG